MDLETIWMWVVGGFRILCFYLDEIVYGFIMDLYDIFRYICGIRVANNAIMNELSTRIGWILGLIMFFYISFDFVQILLDPDKISDKDKGPVSIIKKFLIVIVLLGTSRYIFDLMYNFQDIVLSNDNGNGSIIEKLILPFKVNTSSFGRAITVNFMYNFYKVSDLIDYEIDDSGVVDLKDVDDTEMKDYKFSDCILYTHLLYTTIQNEGSFSIGNECLIEKFEATSSGSSRKEFFIDFNLISLPVGLFVAWTLLMYCISVGMRVIQLAVLQIISPAAIICYLSPNKENAFMKWLRIYFSTYIDVFIRIAIIDFVVLLSGLILEFNQVSTSGVSLTSKMEFWAKVFMVLALLSFAKKAPELFKKLLPDKLQSGLTFGLGSQDRAGLGILGGALAGGVTGIIGGVAGGKGLSKVSGFFSGAVGGLGRGLSAGWTGKNLRDAMSNSRKNQAAANLSRAQRIASGQSWLGSVGDRFRSDLGMTPGGAAADTADINTLKEYAGLQESIEGYADNNSAVKDLLRAYENIKQGGRIKVEARDAAGNVLHDKNGQIIYRDEDDAAFADRIEKARKRYKNAQHAFIEAAANNRTSFNYTDTSGVAHTENFAADDLNASNIQAGINERNRIQRENRSLFESYADDTVRHGNVAGSTWDQLDSNTNRAKSDIAKKSATRRRETGK